MAPCTPQLLHPQLERTEKVLPLLVVPQFALTFGNSIVATENTARILYGEQAQRVTVRALSLSIGILNLVSAAIQGAPLCHGRAASRRTIASARAPPSRATSLAAFASCWRCCGGAAVGLLHLIPLAVLGVFLVYVGVQHAAYLRDLIQRWPQLIDCRGVGVVSFLTNLMWGALLGFASRGFSGCAARRSRGAARPRALCRMVTLSPRWAHDPTFRVESNPP